MDMGKKLQAFKVAFLKQRGYVDVGVLLSDCIVLRHPQKKDMKDRATVDKFGRVTWG